MDEKELLFVNLIGVIREYFHTKNSIDKLEITIIRNKINEKDTTEYKNTVEFLYKLKETYEYTWTHEEIKLRSKFPLTETDEDRLKMEILIASFRVNQDIVGYGTQVDENGLKLEKKPA